MKGKNKLKPRTKQRTKQRTSMKYTGTKNVAAAMAVNHRNQAVIVPRRTK